MGNEQPSSELRASFTVRTLVIIIALAIAVCVFVWPLRPRDLKTRVSVCVSNERQLALGLHAYAADFGDRLPIAATWPAALRPYFGRRAASKIFVCPNDKDPKQVPAPGGGKRLLLSYAMTERFGFENLNDCARPDTTVLLFDCDTVPLAMPANAALRHNGGADFAFVDGHVMWFSPTLHPDTWPPGRK